MLLLLVGGWLWLPLFAEQEVAQEDAGRPLLCGWMFPWMERVAWMAVSAIVKGLVPCQARSPWKTRLQEGRAHKRRFKSLSLAAPNLPFPSAFKPRKSSPVVWDLRSRQGPHQEDFLHPKNPNPNQSPAQPPSGEAFLPSMWSHNQSCFRGGLQ